MGTKLYSVLVLNKASVFAKLDRLFLNIKLYSGLIVQTGAANQVWDQGLD
jgi:hypothetical protein